MSRRPSRERSFERSADGYRDRNYREPESGRGHREDFRGRNPNYDRRDYNQRFDRRDRNEGGRRQFDSRGFPPHRGFSGDRPDFFDRNCDVPSSIPISDSKLSFVHGTKGKKIEVITNNFKIDIENHTVYHYDVNFVYLKKDKSGKLENASESEADQDKAKARLEIFLKKFSLNLVTKLLESKNLAKIPFAYDGSKALFFKEDFGFSVVEEVIDIDHNGRKHSFNVKIQRVTHLCLERICSYFSGAEKSIPDSFKQLLDVLFNDAAASKFKVFRGSSFDVTTPINRPGINHLQFVNGFRGCVRKTVTGYLFNIQLKSACIISNKFFSLESLYKNCVLHNSSEELNQFNSLVKHLEIFCNHGVPRTYKIEKILSIKPDSVQATNEMNMIQYFKSKYNLQINPNNFVVKAISKSPIYLPLELCMLTVNQFLANNKITAKIQQEMLRMSTNSPNIYFNKIEKYVNEFSKNNEKLSHFGFKVDTRPLSLYARILEKPKNNGSERNGSFQSPTKRRKFSLFCLDIVNTKVMENFCREFESSARRYGLNLTRSNIVSTRIQNVQDLVAICTNISTRLKDEIILIAIPKHNSLPSPSQIYNIVKLLSERTHSFITQCLKMDVIFNIPRGYFDNFLMKINGKYGGVNQALERNSFRDHGLNPSKTMVVGIDVNHPGSLEVTQESVVAVVGSLDDIFSKYTSSISKQIKRKIEIIDNLGYHIERLFQEYFKQNRYYPETLVVFRDGVSDGQFKHCFDYEIPSIESCFQKLGMGNINIVFLVAQKRHGVRFALMKPDTTGRNPSYNLPPGTVVDTGIVSTDYPNFFLTSHQSPLGTARNIHYHILRNDQKMSMDHIQSFVFRTCFNSIRSKQISSIPLALRYVHLLAYRGKIYSEAQAIMQKADDVHDVSSEIANNLFYC